MPTRLPPIPTSSPPLVLLDRILSARLIQTCIPSQISQLSPGKLPATFLRNSSCVSLPSAPCITPSISLFSLTARINHRSVRQCLPLCTYSFHPFLCSFSSYTASQSGHLATEATMVTDIDVV